MASLARFLVRRSGVVIGLTVLLTLSAAASLYWVTFDADVTTSIASGTDDGRAFLAQQAKYQSGDPITVMIARADNGPITDRQGLETVWRVKEQLARVPGVKSVATLVPDTNPMTGAPFTKETLDAMPDGTLPYLTNTPMAAMLKSEDGRAALGVINVDGDAISVAKSLLSLKAPEGSVVTVAGNPVIFAQVLSDLGWFLLFIPPLVVISLLLVFKLHIGDKKLAVFAVVPAFMGSLWTFGFITILGHPIDLVTVIVPIWVIVMGSADGLHFVIHLQSSAALTDDKVAQTESALREVGVPMILTTVSTAIGFLSMLSTDVAPLQKLGVFAATGISFAGLISFFFLPALLSRIKIPKPSPHAISERLTALFVRLVKSRVPAFFVVVGTLVFAAVFIPKLSVNPDQLFFFKDDHPVRAAFSKMSDTFGGATPLFGEFAFDPKGDVDAQAVRMRELSRELEKIPNVKRAFSLADVIESIPESMKEDVQSGAVASPLGKMVSDDGWRFVVFPRTLTEDDIRSLKAFVDSHEEVRALTGQPMLMQQMNKLVVSAQVRSLSLALGLLAVLLLVTYRRFTSTVVALVPMVLTVAALLGFLSASGIHLNLITALASSIVIGVGIDYVIHLFAAIEIERANGDGYATRALQHVSRPILANAMGVAVGMSALFLSPLKPHGELALVMWVSMIMGAVTTLLLVPAFLPRRATAENPSG